MGEDRIDMVLEVYEREKPDMVVATGDMVDGNMRGKDHLADLLRAVNPPLGKYAVLGNHEFYRGPEQAVEFLERAGFEVLRCGWVNVGDHIVVAGVDDPAGNGCDEEKALKGVDPSRFVILLKHRPSVRRETLPLIDLQLSGHSHGGVLFFVGLTVLRVLYETDRGIREVAPGKFIVVSKGVGTGGPPMRLLSPPDVAVITLARVEGSLANHRKTVYTVLPGVGDLDVLYPRPLLLKGLQDLVQLVGYLRCGPFYVHHEDMNLHPRYFII
ncbi:MAG: metallophosphoesterase [Aquificota bacterium]|nr:metallophosphoesterase [Aquificota bacterium]